MAKIDDSVKKKVPELRFPGFTDDWEERKLSDIVVRLNKSSNNNQLPKVEFEDIIAGEGRLNKDISRKFDDRKGTLFEPDNILYGKLRPYLKNWLFSDFKGIALGDFWVFKSKNSEPKFVYSLIQADNYQRVANDTSGTKMPRSDWKKVSSSNFSIPTSLEEQQKIGSFFKQLDNTIALHQRKLDLLKEQKKGYLQKMFPKNGAKVPELRFAGFADDWEERKLGDISYKVKEKNKTGEFTETLTNSAEYGIINQRDFFDKDISNAKNLTGYYVVKNDDFVYNPRISNFAPVGPIKRNKLGRTGVMSPLYYVFRTHDIDKNYFEKYFDTVYWHRFMELNGDSGARADRFAIKDSVFVEMPIPYPTMDEQQKIGSFFKQLDDTIDLHQRKLDLLKEQKKGFLQKMFV